MINKRTFAALAVGATMILATGAEARDSGGAENGLLGIKLFDTGLRVASIYGTPDEILAVNVGSGSAMTGAGGGGGGFGGGSSPFGAGGPRGGTPFGGGGGGGKGGSSGMSDETSPFDFGDKILQGGRFGGAQGGPPPGFGAPSGGPFSGGAPGGAGFGGGRPGAGGFGGAGFGGGSSGSAAPRGGGGAAEAASYTRWIYNRNNSKYSFVIDKFGRVVQIEAIGISNPKVKTRRGIGFGATFLQLIKKYWTPDGYEISGDNVTVKFLSKDKVAFRLSRLGDKKPQVVTGIVVAAAKG